MLLNNNRHKLVNYEQCMYVYIFTLYLFIQSFLLRVGTVEAIFSHLSTTLAG